MSERSGLVGLISDNLLKIYFLDTRAVCRHVEDIKQDFNYSSAHTCIFSATRLTETGSDAMYSIDGYNLFRNDSQGAVPILGPVEGLHYMVESLISHKIHCA